MKAYVDDLVELHHGDHADLDVVGADLAIVDPPYGDTSLPWDRLAVDWLDTVERTLAPNGSVWLWGSMRSLVVMLPAAEARGWVQAQDIVWEKHNGSGSAADRFRRVHEHAVQLYRGPWRGLMRSVMFERSAHGSAIHPTQKPLGVTMSLVQQSCPPGGLVVVPYAGSATDLVAARLTGRRAIGAEVDAGYVSKAATRLSEELTLFGGQAS